MKTSESFNRRDLFPRLTSNGVFIFNSRVVGVMIRNFEIIFTSYFEKKKTFFEN